MSPVAWVVSGNSITTCVSFFGYFAHKIKIGSKKTSIFLGEGVCIATSGNISANGNLCFRVFKLSLKVINKNVCYCTVYESIKSIKVTLPIVPTYLFTRDSWNYMPPILVSSSAKHTVTQVLVIAKLNRRTNFVLRGFVCDIKRLSNELPVQS